MEINILKITQFVLGLLNVIIIGLCISAAEPLGAAVVVFVIPALMSLFGLIYEIRSTGYMAFKLFKGFNHVWCAMNQLFFYDMFSRNMIFTSATNSQKITLSDLLQSALNAGITYLTLQTPG